MRDTPPPRDDLVVVPELGVKNRCLHVVEARIESPHLHVAFLVPAVIAEQLYATGDFRITGDDCSHVSEAAEDLRRIEAERRRYADRAGWFPLESRSQRLCRVLDDHQAVVAG